MPLALLTAPVPAHRAARAAGSSTGPVEVTP